MKKGGRSMRGGAANGAKRRGRRALSLRGRLMLFLSLMAAATLVLVGLLTTRFLPRQYNRYIEARLTAQAERLAGLITDSETEISRRTPWGLELNADF